MGLAQEGMVSRQMSASSRRVLVVFVTTQSRREALRIAKAAVRKKLAACGNVVPSVSSIFRWKGVQSSREGLLIMKTSARRYPALAKLVQSMHSYEVPEIIALSIDKGLDPYLEWVCKETATD